MSEAAVLSADVEAALRYLDAAAGRKVSSGLHRIRRICSALGDPQTGPPTVHVTGTNGKGSTARLTAALLAVSGRRTGLFTSPHLVHVSERIVIDGEPVAEGELAAALARMRPILDGPDGLDDLGDRGEGPSRFEIFTALALDLFRTHEVDARVVEVGVGGRLDTTNVIDAEVAVLTTIDLDHVEYLGRTREAIATDKAGIIKPGATAVAGPLPPALLDIVERRCADVGGRLLAEGRDYAIGANRPTPTGRSISLSTPGARYGDLELPFRGAHQGRNAACALLATEALLDRPPGEETVRTAWKQVTNPGRFEVFGDAPPVVVDVAHNPHGVGALVEQLREQHPGRAAVVVIGVNPRKDVAGMLRLLRPHARTIIATRATGAPGVPAADLAALARAAGCTDVHAVPEPAAALGAATALAGAEDLVLCTGSHYWIGEVYGRIAGRR